MYDSWFIHYLYIPSLFARSVFVLPLGPERNTERHAVCLNVVFLRASVKTANRYI